MDFLDWFDITNADHLKAYKQLSIIGCWPENFIPHDIDMPMGWNISLLAKMANAYVNLKIG